LIKQSIVKPARREGRKINIGMTIPYEVGDKSACFGPGCEADMLRAEREVDSLGFGAFTDQWQAIARRWSVSHPSVFVFPDKIRIDPAQRSSE